MGCSRSQVTPIHPSPDDISSRTSCSLENVLESACLSGSKESILEWCAQERITTVEDLLASEERLADALRLRVLERKRLLVALHGDPNLACFAEIPEPPVGHAPPVLDSSSMLYVKIRTISGSVIQIAMSLSSNVLDLKTQLRKLDTFLADKQFRLLREGAELMNKWLIFHCGLDATSVLHLALYQPADPLLDGVAVVLDECGLGRYVVEVHSWLSSAGASSLNELKENANRLITDVGLHEAESEAFLLAFDVEKFLDAQEAKKLETLYQDWVVAQQVGSIIVAEEIGGVYLACNKSCCCFANIVEISSKNIKVDKAGCPCSRHISDRHGCPDLGQECCFICWLGVLPLLFCSDGRVSSNYYRKDETLQNLLASKQTWSRPNENIHFKRTSDGFSMYEDPPDFFEYMMGTNCGILIWPRFSSQAQSVACDARDTLLRSIYAENLRKR